VLGPTTIINLENKIIYLVAWTFVAVAVIIVAAAVAVMSSFLVLVAEVHKRKDL
jgi:hypothetical protein